MRGCGCVTLRGRAPFRAVVRGSKRHSKIWKEREGTRPKDVRKVGVASVKALPSGWITHTDAVSLTEPKVTDQSPLTPTVGRHA